MLKQITSLNIFIFFLLLSFTTQISTKDSYISENSVIKLNEDNLGIAMQEFKYLPILFYSSTDPNCINTIKEYEKAAITLKKENLILSKLDSDESSDIIQYFNVQAIPSIALLYHGKPEFYEGEKKEEEIISWFMKKTEGIFAEINNEKELEEFIKQYDLSMIYFGHVFQLMRRMILAQRKIDDIPMGRVHDENLIYAYAQPGYGNRKNEYIILFTSTELKKYYLYNISSENIIEFFNLYSTPKVIEFSAQTTAILFSKRQNSLMVFSSKDSSHYEEMKSLLNKLWPKLNKKLKLFISDINEGMSVRLSEYCGVKEKDIPIVYILEPVSTNPIKYRFQGEITEENILNFVSDWEKGKIKPYMKSEPEYEYNNDDVFNLVGNSYKREVIENDKDVVVYFYAPWCEKCKNFYPKLEKLARKLKKRNEKLMFAKMDATENDIEYFVVNKYPTIKFYPGNAKEKEPIHINNRLGIVEILDLIKSKAFHKINDENYDRKKETELEEIEKQNELLTSDL